MRHLRLTKEQTHWLVIAVVCLAMFIAMAVQANTVHDTVQSGAEKVREKAANAEEAVAQAAYNAKMRVKDRVEHVKDATIHRHKYDTQSVDNQANDVDASSSSSTLDNAKESVLNAYDRVKSKIAGESSEEFKREQQDAAGMLKDEAGQKTQASEATESTLDKIKDKMAEATMYVQDKAYHVKEALANAVGSRKAATEENLDSLKESAGAKAESAYDTIKAKGADANSYAQDKAHDAKLYAQDKASHVSDQANSAYDSIKEKAAAAKLHVQDKAGHVADALRPSHLRQEAVDAAEGIKDYAEDKAGHANYAAHNAYDTLKDKAENAKQYAQDKLHHASDAVHGARSEAADESSRVGETIQDKAREAKMYAQDKAQHVKEAAESAYDAVKEKVSSQGDSANAQDQTIINNGLGQQAPIDHQHDSDRLSTKDKLKEKLANVEEAASQHAYNAKMRVKDRVEHVKNAVKDSIPGHRREEENI